MGLGITGFGWAAIVIAAVLMLALAIFVLKLRRRSGSARGRTEPDNRIEVLETKVIDAERRLVLVRCDDVEHLIMTGGPADVVVESDVKKARPATPAVSAAKPAAKQAGPLSAPEPRINGAARAELAAPLVEPAPKPASKAPDPRHPKAPSPEPRHAAPRPALSAVAPTPQPLPQGLAAQPTASQRRPEPSARREPPAPTAQALPNPAQAGGGRRGQGGERRGRGHQANREAQRAPSSMPQAEVPWAEADSIENEIVRALRVDPNPPLQQVARSPSPPPRQEAARAVTDPSTTLGDLAERLEEALAREVQAANDTGGRLDLGLDAYVAPQEVDRAAERGPERSAAVRERSEPRNRAEPRAITAAPEPERREVRAPERQEESPVINLNSRRRETQDPLEDEMARLLGELTGDTGRR